MAINSQHIKQTLIPYLKAIPFIAAVVILSGALALRVIIYTTPKYESVSRMKLDDQSYGFSATNLYKNFDLFSTTNKIAAEVEVLKSKELIRMALAKTDYEVSYYRIGQIRTSEIYHEAPFRIHYENIPEYIRNKKVSIFINDTLSFRLTAGFINETYMFDEKIPIEQGYIQVKRNSIIFEKKLDEVFKDEFCFVIEQEGELINKVKADLDVKEKDKDIAIVRISYRSEVAEKAHEIPSLIAETYIEQFVNNKSAAAEKTLQFIDRQLSVVSDQLMLSEQKLERYKLSNNIVNTLQESEAGLKKIAQLKIIELSIETDLAMLDSIYVLIKSKKDLSGEIGFELISDPVYTELMVSLKALNSKRKDLLLKYTSDNEHISNIDEKIIEVREQIEQSIIQARNNAEIRIENSRRSIEKAYSELEAHPTKERNLIELQRNFEINQRTYNFLMEKRTEASIASAANISFHQIIDYSELPTKPVSPKSKFIMIIAVFLGFLGSVSIIYLREFFSAKVRSRNDLERYTDSEIIGVVPRFGKNGKPELKSKAFKQLLNSLLIRKVIWEKSTISIASSVREEGKSFIAGNLAKVLSENDYKVLLIQTNIYDSVNDDQQAGLSEFILSKTEDYLPYISNQCLYHLMAAGINRNMLFSAKFFRNFQSKIATLKMTYDFIIFDTAATAISSDAHFYLKNADASLYILRSNFTRLQYASHVELMKEEHGIKNLSLLLNSVHKATNFNGYYTGSNYNYNKRSKGPLGWIKHYYQYYIRR